MKEIDLTNWREFSLGGDNGLFDIILPIGDIQAQRTNDGSIPLVSSGKNNNGICKYIEKTSESNIIPANTITIDMFGKAFYHDYEYYCVSHGRVNILIPKFNMSKYIGLYLTKVIEIVTIPKYEFLDMCSQGALMKDIIKLPVNEKGEPDWQYMENYIKSIEKQVNAKLYSMQSIEVVKKDVDYETWKEFLLGGKDGLFNIKKGSRLTKADMKDGDINYIGATSFNNGITNHIANSEKLHQGNTITVNYNGSVGEAFYQKDEFWASDDVNVLYPKFLMNENIALFIIPLIKFAGLSYKFIDKWKLEDMENTIISLPVDGDGNPDWGYMDNYITQTKEKAKNRIKNIENIQ